MAGTASTCSNADVYGARPAGSAVRQTVTLGDTQVVLTGTSPAPGGGTAGAPDPNGLDGGRLTITRSGHPIGDQPIVPPAGDATVDLDVVGPVNPSADANPDASAGPDTSANPEADPSQSAGSLCLVRFSPGAEPTAFLALTTGGAHCCTVLRAVPTVAVNGKLGATVDHDFGNFGPGIRMTTYGPLLVSADNAFAYTFSSFAGSYPPIQLFTFAGGTYTDVTRAHPDLVKADLAVHWTAYTDPGNLEPLGALAGWAADECLLDPLKAAPTVWPLLDQLNATGKLGAPSGWPSGSAFIAALRDLLATQGYCVSESGGMRTAIR